MIYLRRKWKLKFFFAWLPRPRKTVANIGALIVGGVTVLSWVFWFSAPLFLPQGEGWGVPFLALLPIMFLGWMATDAIARDLGWNYTPGHEVASQVLAVVLTVTLNMLAVWLLLTLLTKAIKFLFASRKMSGR